MSTDPATFVAGVPVKISERFRPPRRVTIPTSCQHQINPDLLTQEYDFAVEKTALSWLQERRTRREREDRERKERIAEYDRKKAERKAKEEEEERLRKEKEEEDRQRILREEEEKRKQEEEKRQLEEERRKEEEQNQEVKDITDDGCSDEEESVKNQTTEAESDEPSGKTPSTTSQETLNTDSQQLHPGTQESTPVTSNLSSDNTYPTSTSSTTHTTSATYTTDPGTPYDWMLKPTLIPSQKNNVKSPLKTPAHINFADFEGEGNDPFDSAALKSINEMEELAKVLDSSNLGQQSVEGNNVGKQNTSDEGSTPVNNFSNRQVPYNVFSQYPYYMQQQQQQQLQQQQQQQNISQSQQGFGQYASHMSKTSQVTSSPSTVPSYSTGSQYGGDPSRAFQNTYYPQQWNNGFNVSSPSKAAQYMPYDYRLQASNVPSSVANTTQSGVMSPGSSSGSTSTVPISTNSSFPTMPSVERGTTPSKRPDLEDFYSRYYSQNKATTQQNQHSGGQSGESTPSHSSSSGAAGSTNGSLRSSRSVPDLTAAEDSEVTRFSSGIQTNNEGRVFSHTPPPRPSSTGLTGLEDWKPLPNLSEPPETLSNQHLYQSGSTPHPPLPPSYTPVKSRLPDPFTELTTDAQALVQSMAEMGFPRPRVARAVQKLGTDHKKLIEVLLVLQSLQENGEDGYKAERAFYHYLGDVQKTRDHLAAAKQLLDLGFEEERIVDALLKHNNDRDKALEELIA
ncbi:capping protein inhibiting regulator of actin dynamics-like [Homarus americanus]|uniref:Ubiquitin-associated protein 1-like n=1 Tax=Homarus americanus TaxID=6706 RepID=A0A8J5JD74_HOMAM|nr:capping protein inhibiting regulator of actin dynamics-like [Homarus americanus]XP_042207273.1 capping protein inhibiting regulator of actin dynamics-like [Homarus americanus]KAG7154571.1 Ubiquitin-associated protein 1-like [Homarus americanus]